MNQQELIGGAAHALKSPLRSMGQLCEIILKDHAAQLDETGQEVLRLVVQAAIRGQRTVDSLLIFTRLDSDDMPVRELIDSNELVETVLQDLEYDIKEAGATITLYSLPIGVSANRQWIRIVFQSLIENALKFKDETYPDIWISGETQARAFFFCVADNGVGIPEKYRQDIFEPFRRLQADDSGAGLGLTICKRVIEKHGGQIWVEPNPDGGSRFCFTIPKN